MGFKTGSFDGFMTLYGFLPHPLQIVGYQLELARILKPNGLGYITSTRKQYVSYWYLMSAPFPPAMNYWLRTQTPLDFFFSTRDDHTEKLFYGLYKQTHITESLTEELSQTFEVLECHYDDDDPRYISALVTPKSSQDRAEAFMNMHPVLTPQTLEMIETQLQKIESLCEHLEKHTARVLRCFEDNRSSSPKWLFQTIDPGLERFIPLLEAILETSLNV
jgi:hypothetical protein